jgi:hypothetical protein
MKLWRFLWLGDEFNGVVSKSEWRSASISCSMAEKPSFIVVLINMRSCVAQNWLCHFEILICNGNRQVNTSDIVRISFVRTFWCGLWSSKAIGEIVGRASLVSIDSHSTITLWSRVESSRVE